MVAITHSFFFVSLLLFCNALPTPLVNRSFQSRAPQVGQKITLSSTKNDPATGVFTADGDDIELTVGNRLGEGSSGQVFEATCNSPACTGLGPVVLKFHTDKDQVEGEQKNLAKIDELKAVSTGASDQVSLMKGFTGKPLSKTDAYLALTDKVTDKTKLDVPAIKTLVDQTNSFITANAQDYLAKHQILHGDINDANVLVTEKDGKITGAQLIDWDKADIIADTDIEAAKKEVPNIVNTAFQRLVDEPETAKNAAVKAAAAKKKTTTNTKPKKPVTGSTAPTEPADPPTTEGPTEEPASGEPATGSSTVPKKTTVKPVVKKPATGTTSTTPKKP